MDSLEAFERGRDLPPEALNHDSPINPFRAEIIPLRVEPSIPHVWQGYNRSAVFFLDERIVVKAQKQYHIPSVSLPGDRMLLELGLANFTAKNPDLLNGILFFERLEPLTAALAESNVTCRRRWAIELASAFAHLESLGLIPTHACVRDLGLDKNGRLKLTGFGASPRRPCSGVQQQQETAAVHHQESIPSAKVTRKNIGSAHQRLASCLHYILTGVDPDEQAQQMGDARYSQTDRIQWREKVRHGEYAIATGAEPIADILQDAWTLRTTTSEEAVSFSEVERKIRDALGPVNIEDDGGLQSANNVDLEMIEERCRAWLGAQEREPKWMGWREYEEAVREATADCGA